MVVAPWCGRNECAVVCGYLFFNMIIEDCLVFFPFFHLQVSLFCSLWMLGYCMLDVSWSTAFSVLIPCHASIQG